MEKNPLETYDKGEFLTGFIGDKKASDLEERFANALNKIGLDFEFEVQLLPGENPRFLQGSQRNQLGAVEIDFLIVQNETMFPVQIDGEFAHKTAEQRERDKEQDQRLDDSLRQFNAYPVKRVPFYEIETPEQAEQIAKDIQI